MYGESLGSVTVLGGESSNELAQKIARRLRAPMVATRCITFPDGECKITLDSELSAERIIVVQSLHPPVDTNLVRALSLVARARESARQVTAVIPYMGYARQDRKFLPGEIVSMKVLAKLFKSAGASGIVMVDMHSMAGLKHFKMDAKNVSAVPELARHFKRMDLDRPLVVSPDQGGKRRAEEFAAAFKADHAALEKQRDRTTGAIHIRTKELEGVRGRDMILVDDMISTGGSIVKAARFLRRCGCGKIFVACTHGLLIGGAEKKIQAIRRHGHSQHQHRTGCHGSRGHIGSDCQGSGVMSESFFILSKEYPEIAATEVAALARTYDRFAKIKSFSNIVTVQSKTDWSVIARRAAFVRTAGQILRKMSWLFSDDSNLAILRNADGFACRVINLSASRFDTRELEDSMGDMISKFSRAAVSLESPDVTIYLVFTGRENFFGFSKRLAARQPEKISTHPHELDRRLARAMINMAGLKEGDTVCDPFCGTGTTLLEAESMGINGIGIDYDKKMTDMSWSNLRHNGFDSEIINSDFGRLAEMHDMYDGVVTDLPYGRASKTSEDPARLLKRLVEMLPRRKKAAIMCKKGFEGMTAAKRYDIYRHKSLTRTILVR